MTATVYHYRLLLCLHTEQGGWRFGQVTDKNQLLEDWQQTSETQRVHFRKQDHNESFPKLPFSPEADPSGLEENCERHTYPCTHITHKHSTPHPHKTGWGCVQSISLNTASSCCYLPLDQTMHNQRPTAITALLLLLLPPCSNTQEGRKRYTDISN